MNDFDYDVKQKKAIAQNARYKKHNKKGCTLPSDNLTEAQKRKLNGEVKTMEMGKPVTWEQLNSWPTDIQREYLVNIREGYRATDDMLGAMLGVSDVAVFHKRRSLWGGWTSLKGMSKKDKEARDSLWEEFLYGKKAEEPKTEPKPKEKNVEELPTVVEKRKVSVVREINLVLTEARTWDDIMSVLKGYPIPDGCVVSVNIKGGE